MPALHVEDAAQTAHGALPDVENVVPATHASGVAWHTVFDVLVQAVFTPAAHVEATTHDEHGSLPDKDHDEPVAHGTTEHVNAAQAVKSRSRAKFVFDFQASKIIRFLHPRRAVPLNAELKLYIFPTSHDSRPAPVNWEAPSNV